LPGGDWYDFWSGERQAGGHVEAEAPLERMPLYVRAGTVLPRGPVMQHTGQWPPEALHLHIYPGDGQSWLYEDDGRSLDYQAGDFRLTRFACRAAAGSLAVSRLAQGPYEPGYARFEIYLHGQDRAPASVTLDGRGAEVAFDPETRTARFAAGPWHELHIRSD